MIRKSSTALADFKAKIAGGSAGAGAGGGARSGAKNGPAEKRFPVIAVEPTSTEDVEVSEQLLDDTDKAFVAGAWFSEEERKALSSLHAFTATMTVGTVKATIPMRCVAAPKASRVMLCLSGQGEDRSLVLWSKFWPAMLSKGYHVVAIDLPGYGRASGADDDYKSWKDEDAALLQRLIKTLQLPDNCVTVFAEGTGGNGALRAMAKDGKPFGPHHVLFACGIAPVPDELGDQLDSIGGDLALYWTEKLHAAQKAPVTCVAASTLQGFLFDPSNMGRFCGDFVIWHVRKDFDGKDAVGPGSFKSMRQQEMWWVGRPVAIAGAARSPKALMMWPSQECIDEIIPYVTSPARKIKSDEDSNGRNTVREGWAARDF